MHEPENSQSIVWRTSCSGSNDSRIQWPDAEQQREFSDMILMREPELNERAFAFVDGCSFPVEVGCSQDEKNAHYYHSWKSGTFINNLFLYLPP
jgi:hypothetical protein